MPHYIRLQCKINIQQMEAETNSRHFADDIFKCIFMNENVAIVINISVKLIPESPVNNIPAPGRRQAIIWTIDG